MIRKSFVFHYKNNVNPAIVVRNRVAQGAI